MKTKTPVNIHFYEPKKLRINRHAPPISFFLFLAVFCSIFEAQAQSEKPKNLVPPPLVLLSDNEKEQLEAQKDLKKRTDLALQLMEARMKNAEELSSQRQYKEALNEFGAFQALINNTLRFLNRNNTGNRKVLNNYKRFEISLRNYSPRLEIIRREMPIRYGYHVQTLMKYVRDARTKATEPIFGDTVLPGSQ